MVLFEDTADLIGIVLAALGTYAASSLKLPVLDGVASILHAAAYRRPVAHDREPPVDGRLGREAVGQHDRTRFFGEAGDALLHSCRNASIGSICAARRAGKYPNSTPMAAENNSDSRLIEKSKV